MDLGQINLRGAFLLAQSGGPTHMIGNAPQRSIINIDSLNTYAPLKGVTPMPSARPACR